MSFHLFSEESCSQEGIIVNLRDPVYSEGNLKTDQGGLITAEGIRIQARNILYSRKVNENETLCKMEAEGDLLIEFGDYIFVGKRIEYDFQKKTGVIYEGKTSFEPWFFGGKFILLHADGTYTFSDTFLTTSPNSNMEWKLSSTYASLNSKQDLYVKNLKFQYYNVPLFWLPCLKVNVETLKDFPIRYFARWGGRQGPRIEFIYRLFSWNRWKTYLRFDYRLTRGPGLGLETYYCSEDHKERFEAINYAARDSSLTNPHEKFRYRFQGAYSNSYLNDKVNLNLTYDKLSDEDMATDYRDSGLDLQYPGATMLSIRRQESSWIANFLTTMRLNSFQTLKQELPTFRINWKPFNLGTTGIIANQNFRASYLDYKYSGDMHDHRHDYNSTRIQYLQQFYRPFQFSSLLITPEIGGTVIFYGNLPRKNERWLTIGIFKLDAQLPYFKQGHSFTHTLIPYTRYEFYTMPTSLPRDHYIFDIDDGLYELNMLRFGIQQALYFRNSKIFLYRPMKLDVYANCFINSKTYHKPIPKVYGVLDFYTSPVFKHRLSTAWDFEHSILDHFNFRTECTFSENAALSLEYRHRSPYDFRKADPTNFILDAFLSPSRLKDSALSDRRDTLLMHLFYRFHPLWALEFQMRHGWNRKHQPGYTEFGIDLIGRPHAAWQLKFSYQHSENDRHRLTVYFNMGTMQLDCWKINHLIPQVSF